VSKSMQQYILNSQVLKILSERRLSFSNWIFWKWFRNPSNFSGTSI